MNNIRKHIKKAIEDILRDYNNFDKYIKEREEEIRYPILSVDENIGGGKTTNISKPQETTVITIEQDKRLQTLIAEREAIKRCFENANHDTQIIINELYFKKYPNYTINGLIFNKIIFCGKSKAHELKNNFIKEVGISIDLIKY